MNRCEQRQQRHNKKVLNLVQRVLQKGYDTVLMNIPYWINGSENTHGELDVLTIRDKYVTYYEVKGCDSSHSLRKAVYQTNEFGRNLHNTTNLDQLIPPDAVYRKIYVSFNKSDDMIVKRLK